MKVTKFQLLLVPTALGQAGIQIYGLGDDNKMYMWDHKKVGWVIVKS